MPQDILSKLKYHFSQCLSYESTGKNEVFVCEENKKGVKCEVKKHDKVLGIVIDKDFEGRCRERREGCIEEGEKCDGLIFFQKYDIKNIILVEIKGEDLEKAVKQIIETAKYIVRRFPKHNYSYKVGAVIIYTGSTPKKQKSKSIKNEIKRYINKELKKYNKKAIIDITYYVKS